MLVPSGFPYRISPKAQLLELVWLGMSTGLFGTSQSLWSSTYMIHANCSCLRLFKQTMAWALALARPKTGRSRLAKMAMIAMTTRSSIRVNPRANPPLTPPRRGIGQGAGGTTPSPGADRLEGCPTFLILAFGIDDPAGVP